jgi:hypothetical protein
MINQNKQFNKTKNTWWIRRAKNVSMVAEVGSRKQEVWQTWMVPSDVSIPVQVVALEGLQNILLWTPGGLPAS